MPGDMQVLPHLQRRREVDVAVLAEVLSSSSSASVDGAPGAGTANWRWKGYRASSCSWAARRVLRPRWKSISSGNALFPASIAPARRGRYGHRVARPWCVTSIVGTRPADSYQPGNGHATNRSSFHAWALWS